MFERLSTILVIGLVSVWVLPAGAWAQAPAAAAKTDQGEYDISQAIAKENDPGKKLDLLHQWEQKYPDSQYKGNRAVQIVQTESQIMAKALQPNAAAGDMDAAQKSAQDLVDNVDKYLSPENKPANVTDDQWKQAMGAKAGIVLQAHSALAAVAIAKKNDPVAEAEYRKILAADANSAGTAYQLGILIYRSKNVARFPEAFFWIARAVSITGPEALNAAGKAAADKYLQQAYSGYHGDASGLDDLKKLAATATAPPPDFKIKSVQDIEAEKAGDAAAFAAAHPDIALWRQIRDALKADGGDTYFQQVKGSEIPPQDGTFKMFTGKLVSQPSAKELLLNVDSPAGDAVLRFEANLKEGAIDPGTEIKFKGVVEEFAKEPYVLTLTVDKEDVDGVPATAFVGAAPPRRRPAPKKK